jgi:hypothetical protein
MLSPPGPERLSKQRGDLMISLNELQKASPREKLAIAVSALFFLYLFGVATYVGTARVWMALIGGVVGLVITYRRAGVICSNVGTGGVNR